MYLKDLDYQQKLAFYELANEVIKADNLKTKEESVMLTEYQIEMGIAITEEISHYEAINILNSTTETIKRKVLFELVALSYVDKEVQNEEAELLTGLFNELNVDLDIYEKYQLYVEDYFDLLSKISSTIND